MYRFMKTSRRRFGTDWALLDEFNKFVNAKYDIDLKFFVEDFGDIHKIYWMADFKDMTEMQEVFAQMATDEEYQSYVPKISELGIEGSWKDTLLRER